MFFLLFPISCRKTAPTFSRGIEASLSPATSAVEQKLAQGEHHTYYLELTTAQYFRVLIRHSGIKLKVEFFNPVGQPLQTLNGFHPGILPFSAVAAAKGKYRIEISSLEGAPYTGLYSIQLVEQRATDSADAMRIEADTAFALAESQRLTPTRPALLQARAKYQEAQRLWDQLGEKKEAALSLNCLGELQVQLGEDGAAEIFQQAKSLNSGDQSLQLEIENTLFSLKRVDDGRCQKWQEASRLLGFRRGEALALDNLGELTYTTDIQRSRNYHLQSLVIWRELQDRGKQALALYNLGAICAFFGETTEATEYFQEAKALYQSVDDKNGVAATLTSQGHQQNLLGNKRAALKFYEEALQEAEAFGDPARIISICNGKGFVYESFGEYPNALKLYEQSLQLARQLGDVKKQSGAMLGIGDMYRLTGQPAKALPYVQQALALIEKTQNNLYLPTALISEGLAYEAMGNKGLALATLRKAAAISEQNKGLRRTAQILNEMGRMSRELTRYDESLGHHTQALQFSQQANDPFGESQSRYSLARTHSALGNIVEALSHIRGAIEIIEKSRVNVINPTLRISYLASVHQSYELYAELLVRRHQESPHENLAAEALAISERSRARSLLDLLNLSRIEVTQGADPKLLAQLQTLSQSFSVKAERKMKLAGNKEKEQELAALKQELDALNLQIEEVQTKIWEASPRYAALTQAQPLNAREIQQLLDDNTTLLEFALGDEQSYLWAVTKDSLEVYPLPKRETIEALCGEVYTLMTAPQRQEEEAPQLRLKRIKQADAAYWPKASALSQMLLAPVADKLGKSRLIIVGEGALQRIPFAALPEPATGRQGDRETEGKTVAPSPRHPIAPSPLIVNHEIISLPSASILSLIRQDRVTRQAEPTFLASFTDFFWGLFGKRQTAFPTTLDSVAILADPVFDQDDIRIQNAAARNGQPGGAAPQTRDVDLSDENLKLSRLPETGVEASEIEKAAGAKSFLLKKGFDVNRALLASEELNRYAIIHFATHGYWDNDRPELSGLVLSRFDQQGNRQNGFLRLSDIYNLRMQKELVVLSACETALGKDIRGEGLMALTRGFMYAGASRVIASLWKVEETATVELMKVFYAKLLREKLTPAAALREAQIARWRQAPTSAPYDWAAFVLQGEYR